jgi:glycopeptide antibiotics resistance protein
VPWVALTFVLIGLAAVPVYRWRAGRTSRAHALSWTVRDGAVVASLVTVLAFTVRPGQGIEAGSVMVNFVPFRDLVHSLDLSPFYQRLALGNLAGNILLFVPWGAALALRYRALGVLAVLGICAGLSTGIEAWQGISATGRNVDITDVLMNTFGGVLGFGVVRALRSHPTDRVGPATTSRRPS